LQSSEPVFDDFLVWSDPNLPEWDSRRFHQEILNEDMPEHVHVRPSPERIKVMARLVWEHDGEQWMPAEAARWISTHVLVTWAEPDPRKPASLAWLRAEDVMRR
jgi:hypothetical protein